MTHGSFFLQRPLLRSIIRHHGHRDACGWATSVITDELVLGRVTSRGHSTERSYCAVHRPSEASSLRRRGGGAHRVFDWSARVRRALQRSAVSHLRNRRQRSESALLQGRQGPQRRESPADDCLSGAGRLPRAGRDPERDQDHRDCQLLGRDGDAALGAICPSPARRRTSARGSTYPNLCPGITTLPPDVRRLPGPDRGLRLHRAQGVEPNQHQRGGGLFRVWIRRDGPSLSVGGRGGARQARSRTPRVALLIGLAIGVPVTKLKGVDGKSNGNTVTLVSTSTNPEGALGFVSGETAEAAPTSFDKENVRDGHYPLWAASPLLRQGRRRREAEPPGRRSS